MNYRHAFHAGNFADLVKHAGLLELLRRMTGAGGPLTVIDTHAGRGLYDLAGAEARKSGEADAGVVRLMAAKDAPQAFAALKSAVSALNKGGEVKRYPGSPWLIAGRLRREDRYIACELRPDEHGALKTLLKDRPNIETLCADGYQVAAERIPPDRSLVLIDPPFERADDYSRIVETVAAVRRRNPTAQALVWLPLKDLETFDAFLRDLEDAVAAPLLVGETRMRPLTDPMKMNGCALVLVRGDPALAPHFQAICSWTAAALGDAGSGRAYALAGG